MEVSDSKSAAEKEHRKLEAELKDVQLALDEQQVENAKRIKTLEEKLSSQQPTQVAARAEPASGDLAEALAKIASQEEQIRLLNEKVLNLQAARAPKLSGVSILLFYSDCTSA